MTGDDSGPQQMHTELSVSDMKHLLYGQRVFNSTDDTRLSMEYNEQSEWGAVPIPALVELAEQWESSGFVEDEVCAQELREVIEQYE